MKTLLLFICCIGASAQMMRQPGTGGATTAPGVPASVTYSHCKVVTVGNTLVSGGADLSNFTLSLILPTDNDMRTVANGGSVTNAGTSNDIAFYSSCSGVGGGAQVVPSGTKLAWEIESYTASTGALVAHVLMTPLHAAGDTVGMWFAGTSTTYQSNTATAWGPNYLAVWHLPAASGANSTVNAAMALSGASSATGQVDGAASFNGTSSFGSSAVDLSSTAVITVTMWLNWSSFANSDRLALEYTSNSNSNAGSFIINPENSSGACAGQFTFGSVKGSGSPTYWQDCFTRPSAAAFHHYAFVMDRSTPANTGYLDGVSQSLTAQSHVASGMGNYANSTIYQMSRAGSALFAPGTMDELRIYSGTLSAAWVLTEYRNQSAPGTYLSVGVLQ